MPTEQIRRYFQVASRELTVRWKKISGALARVVASTATHSSPRWCERTTSDMVARKSSMQVMKTRSGSLAPCGSAAAIMESQTCP